MEATFKWQNWFLWDTFRTAYVYQNLNFILLKTGLASSYWCYFY